MNTAYVALGANLGDPAATVRAAFGALANLPESRVSRSSSLYRTAPVGLTDQPDFINAVAELQTTLAPEALLEALFDIEQRFGRIRADKNGPRTLDLDLLLYDDQRIDLPQLQLSAGDARLSAKAELNLKTPRAFTAEGELQRFDPSRFAKVPAAQINANFKADGRLDPRAVVNRRASRRANPQRLSAAEGHPRRASRPASAGGGRCPSRASPARRAATPPR